MKCLECGGVMRTRRENYRYEASGLKNVVLANMEVSRCLTCGYEEVAIPNIEGLHRAIAQVLVRKPVRLAPEEIRYLRKYLGWSGVDFAKHMGVTPETVSRWENSREAIGPQADRLLRLMVVTREPEREYPLETLAAIDETEDTRAGLLGFAVGDEGWYAKAA